MDGQYNNPNCNNRPSVRLNINSNPYPYPNQNTGNCPAPNQQQYPYRPRQFRLTGNPGNSGNSGYWTCEGASNRMPRPSMVSIVVPNRNSCNSYGPRPSTPPAMARSALKPYVSERSMPPPCICPPGRRSESEPSIQTLPTCSSSEPDSNSSLSRQNNCSAEQIVEEEDDCEPPPPPPPPCPPPPCPPQRRSSPQRPSPCPSVERRPSAAECDRVEEVPAEPKGPCEFPQHDMRHLKQQLLKYRGEMQRCSDTAKINAQLNEIFLRRVFDIEHKAGGDVDILLTTYQEWVEMLLQINEVFINNMEDLESEVAERLEKMKCQVKDECKKSQDDVCKYKKDICTLLKFIQNAYHCNNWNVCGLQFQTISPADVLGSQQVESETENQVSLKYSFFHLALVFMLENSLVHLPASALSVSALSKQNGVACQPYQPNRCEERNTGLPRSCSGADTLQATGSYSSGQGSCEQQESDPQLKSYLHALAIEVASKHDEICDLKRQICCLEDEIQKAQQKIQLKDNVIKELRSEVKCANAKLSTQSVARAYSCGESSDYDNMPPINLPPINLDVAATSSRTASTQVSAGPDSYKAQPYFNDDFDTLSQTNHLEQEKLLLLEAELNELFAVAQSCKKQNLECHRKRLSDIFQKSEREKADAYRKLDYIRRQLVDLEACTDEYNGRNTEDSDSGFSSKCDNDQDAKIINSVRKRLRCLNDKLFELKTCMQQLEIENNELATCLNTEKKFAKCNGETLKELADLLCSIRGEQFSYEEIYSSSTCQPNPFCGAILQMKCEMENEHQRLLDALVERDKQLEELESQLCSQNSQSLEASHLETSQMAPAHHTEKNPRSSADKTNKTD